MSVRPYLPLGDSERRQSYTRAPVTDVLFPAATLYGSSCWESLAATLTALSDFQRPAQSGAGRCWLPRPRARIVSAADMARCCSAAQCQLADPATADGHPPQLVVLVVIEWRHCVRRGITCLPAAARSPSQRPPVGCYRSRPSRPATSHAEELLKRGLLGQCLAIQRGTKGRRAPAPGTTSSSR